MSGAKAPHLGVDLGALCVAFLDRLFDLEPLRLLVLLALDGGAVELLGGQLEVEDLLEELVAHGCYAIVLDRCC